MKKPRDITHMFDFLNSPLIGVYGLWSNNTLMYIGQTRRLVGRVTGHWYGQSGGRYDGFHSEHVLIKKEKRIEELKMGFDKVTFWECRDRFESLAYEKLYIYVFKPILNKPYDIPLKYKTEYDRLLYIMSQMKKQNRIDIEIENYLPFKRRI